MQDVTEILFYITSMIALGHLVAIIDHIFFDGNLSNLFSEILDYIIGR